MQRKPGSAKHSASKEGLYSVIGGIYRDNGKENGNYYSIMGNILEL